MEIKAVTGWGLVPHLNQINMIKIFTFTTEEIAKEFEIRFMKNKVENMSPGTKEISVVGNIPAVQMENLQTLAVGYQAAWTKSTSNCKKEIAKMIDEFRNNSSFLPKPDVLKDIYGD